MNTFKLSVITPAYNEAATIKEVVASLLSIDLPGHLELIVVNDGSTDATGEILDAFDDPRLTVVTHEKNRGKGAAVRTGITSATGSHLLVFDADDEYDVADVARLVAPIVSGRAEVIYGSRMSSFGTVHPSLHHAIGNKVMTWAANILFGSAISDLHTCLKLLPTPMLRSFQLTEEGFGLDTEISAEMLRAGFRPYEIPISYVGRSKEEGKKIKFSDALRCFYVLAKVRLRGSTKYGLRDKTLAPKVSA